MKKLWIIAPFAVACSGLIAIVAPGTYYASPTGTGTSCTPASPCSAVFALGASSPAKAGSTIYFRGGAYRGLFTSSLVGVTVTSYPGELASFQGDGSTPADGSVPNVMTINGSSCTFQNLEFLDPFKATSAHLSALIGVHGDGHRIIGCYIHDGHIGHFSAKDATNLQLIGNIDYYNGVEQREHGMYEQNETGTKSLLSNLVFHNAGFGIHNYGSSGPVKGITTNDNIVVQNGALMGTRMRNIFHLSGQAMSGLDVERNLTYDIASGTSAAQLEFDSGANIDVKVIGNYLVGPLPLFIQGFSSAVVTGNTIVPRTGWDAFVDIAPTGTWTFNNNTYTTGYPNEHNAQRFRLNNVLYTFTGFQAKGFDTNSTYSEPASGKPATNVIFVKPTYPGNGFIAAYNWQGLSTVAVNLSSILATGDTYEIRYYQNPLGPAVVSGTYNGGTVTLPLTGLTVANPIPFTGMTKPALTAPEFSAWLVTKKGTAWTPTPTTTAVSPAPSPTFTASPTPTVTPSATATPSPSATKTATATSTATPTATFTATSTPTSTPTSTSTPTVTFTPTQTATFTPTPTPTSTPTPTATPTATFTNTMTPTPTFTMTSTPTMTPTPTPTNTPNDHERIIHLEQVVFTPTPVGQ